MVDVSNSSELIKFSSEEEGIELKKENKKLEPKE